MTDVTTLEKDCVRFRASGGARKWSRAYTIPLREEVLELVDREEAEDRIGKLQATITATEECMHPDFTEGLLHERVSAMKDEINRLRSKP